MSAALTVLIAAALSHADHLEHTTDGNAREEAERIRTAVTQLHDPPPTSELPSSVGADTATLGEHMRFLMEVIADAGHRSLSPPRVELSLEHGTVTAQVMADGLAVPLVGQGQDAPAALGALVETIQTVAREARRRRPPRRRRS